MFRQILDLIVFVGFFVCRWARIDADDCNRFSHAEARRRRGVNGMSEEKLINRLVDASTGYHLQAQGVGFGVAEMSSATKKMLKKEIVSKMGYCASVGLDEMRMELSNFGGLRLEVDELVADGEFNIYTEIQWRARCKYPLCTKCKSRKRVIRPATTTGMFVCLGCSTGDIHDIILGSLSDVGNDYSLGCDIDNSGFWSVSESLDDLPRNFWVK